MRKRTALSEAMKNAELFANEVCRHFPVPIRRGVMCKDWVVEKVLAVVDFKP